MALIEEWRWEKDDENPLQPFWNFFINQLREEHKRMEKEEKEKDKEEIIEEIMRRLKEGGIDE